MNYECKVRIVGSKYTFTHFIDGKKVTIREQEDTSTFNGHPFVPNQYSEWTPFQINELIRLDMLVYEDHTDAEI